MSTAAPTAPETAPAANLPSVKELRHRAEVPMLLMGSALLLIAAIVVIVLIVDGLDAPAGSALQ